jgi:serine/threonine protein kinase
VPGACLGPYEIVALLDSGGMGEVYRARDPRLGRDIAIKILPQEFALDVDRLRRFEQEARTAAALNHPNIVTIHSVEQSDRVLFLTMELIEGRPLSRVMQRAGWQSKNYSPSRSHWSTRWRRLTRKGSRIAISNRRT